jgi:hypothetical protein
VSNVPPTEWRYIAATAEIIAAAWHPALISKAGNARAPIGEEGQICSANKKFSQIFFIFTALRLLVEYESQGQWYRQSADTYLPHFAYCYRNRLLILLY